MEKRDSKRQRSDMEGKKCGFLFVMGLRAGAHMYVYCIHLNLNTQSKRNVVQFIENERMMLFSTQKYHNRIGVLAVI